MKKILICTLLIFVIGQISIGPTVFSEYKANLSRYMPRRGTDIQLLDTMQIWTLKQEIMDNICIAEESKGNDFAHNKDEDARGQLQIRPVMVKECNRIVGYNKYKMSDRTDWDKSTEMFWVYQNYWNADLLTYPIDIKKIEVAFRIWNGGNTGMQKRTTRKYWNKVKDNFKNYRNV